MINDPHLPSSLKKYQSTYHHVVPFDPKSDKLLLLNFTATNTELNEQLLKDTNGLANYVNKKLKDEMHVTASVAMLNIVHSSTAAATCLMQPQAKNRAACTWESTFGPMQAHQCSHSWAGWCTVLLSIIVLAIMARP